MVLHEDKIGQEFLIPKRVTDHFSDDHICYFAQNIVDSYDFTEIHEKYIGTPGIKAYSRQMLLRVLVMTHIDGVTSSRKIARLCEENLVYMYLAGLDTPCYKTLLNFKKEHPDLIGNMMELSVEVAKRSGMVKLGEIAIDGTTVKANASNQSTITENELKQIQELINGGLIKDIEENEEYDDENSGNEINKDLKLKQKVKKVIQEIGEEKKESGSLGFRFSPDEIRRLKEAEKEVEKIKRQREKSPNKDLKKKEIRISLTDPEARFMKNKKR